MQISKTVLLFLSFIFPALLVAQTGTVRGTVIDGETGMTLPGVNIIEVGTTNGTITDLDGKFSLNLAVGKRTLQFSFISFTTQIVDDVEVVENEVTIIDNVNLTTASESLKEVVVTAEMVKNNETALLTLKKKSANMIDGISAASFRKIGDSDAASSMKRVSGVSVEGGKYVFVRGLGDRYTKTLLNGVEVPGLDPDRNTIQMDIFPTTVIDNIVVNKTFVAELPADFTGGIVDIKTRDFPDHKKGVLGFSLGYNPNFHFRNDYLDYNGGATDWLGFDDGTRDIPATENVPFFVNAVGSTDSPDSQRYQEILRGFGKTMSAFETQSLMDFNIAGSFGNQIAKDKVTLGYNVILTYRNNTEFYKDAIYGRYGLSPDPDITVMEVRELQTGSFGVNNVLLSGMAGFAIKTVNSKFILNALHLQNGESKAGVFDYFNDDQGSEFYGIQTNLEYSERAMTNVLLSGKHYIPGRGWDIEWKISPTRSRLEDPDIRYTRYELRDGDYVLGTEAGMPERIWRDLQEWNVSGIATANKTLPIFTRDGKLGFGTAYNYKNRDYIIYKYQFPVNGIELTGNPDEIFFEENLWPVNGDANTRTGTTYDPDFIPINPNDFNAVVNNIAAFASVEMLLTVRLKAIVGVRMENYVQRYTGTDQTATNVLDNDVVLDNLGFYPSLNLVYALNENQNLRVSYSQTVARPSLKELSFAEIFDPITGRTFIGGLFEDKADDGTVLWDGNLTNTDIQNIDLRWEVFPKPYSSVSFGVFYKHFTNPIEIIQYATTPNSFQPRNVGDGEVYGAEFEFRTDLGFLSASLDRIAVNGNFTYTFSRIRLNPIEKQSRIDNARSGQTIDDYRSMAGQAPFIVNAGLVYNGSEKEGWAHGLEAGLYYNVQSSTLEYVGIVDRPDVYTVPFHSLNFNANKRFGKDDKFVVGFNVSNILNDDRESVFRSHNTEDQFFQKLSPGTMFKMRFGYTF